MKLTILEVGVRLSSTAESIRSLVQAVPPEQARWRPLSDRWSVLEVVNHLADEEVEDFRARLDLLLHRPSEPWPSIDPQAWVTLRAYAERDLQESLERFLAERRRSLAWLQRLATPDWERTSTHPRLGPISAGSLLVSWMAHDLLHIRQLARLHFDFLASHALPHSVGYAGTW